MSKKEVLNDTKVSCNILQNKLKNLKEYDTRFGTNILQSLSKNITSIDDVLMKQLGTVDMIGCGNNKYLSSEAESVTNIYTDLLTKIANSQSGCGGDPSEEQSQNKELNKFKKDFITIVGKNAKKGSKSKSGSKKRRSKKRPSKSLVGEGIISMDAKKRRKSKKSTGSKKGVPSKKRGARNVSHIIF